MNNEDIKVLEERINFCKNNSECREELNQCFGCTFEVEEIQAIENLIKGYKDLEEENLKYERANDYLSSLNHKYYEDNVTLLRKNGKVDILADDIHFKYIDDANNYISKSKVREKIEELDKEEQQELKRCKRSRQIFYKTNISS